jgi:hypothetical protein
MVYSVEYAIKLWSYTAWRNLIIILGRFMEITRSILNPRLLLVIWVIWDPSDLFIEQETSSICFVTETRILFVCLEDISVSLTSNLRRKGLSYALITFENTDRHLSRCWWNHLLEHSASALEVNFSVLPRICYLPTREKYFSLKELSTSPYLPFPQWTYPEHWKAE